MGTPFPQCSFLPPMPRDSDVVVLPLNKTSSPGARNSCGALCPSYEVEERRPSTLARSGTKANYSSENFKWKSSDLKSQDKSYLWITHT